MQLRREMDRPRGKEKAVGGGAAWDRIFGEFCAAEILTELLSPARLDAFVGGIRVNFFSGTKGSRRLSFE